MKTAKHAPVSVTTLIANNFYSGFLDHDECLTGGHNCSQRCVNFKSGFLCACFDGYKLTENNSTCIGEYFFHVVYSNYLIYCLPDVDECTDGLSGCSQVCTNIDGTFECSCTVGFTLGEDSQTCEGKHFIYLINSFKYIFLCVFVCVRVVCVCARVCVSMS